MGKDWEKSQFQKHVNMDSEQSQAHTDYSGEREGTACPEVCLPRPMEALRVEQNSVLGQQGQRGQARWARLHDAKDMSLLSSVSQIVTTEQLPPKNEQ